jgi:two-component sensor histidine kinase
MNATSARAIPADATRPPRRLHIRPRWIIAFVLWSIPPLFGAKMYHEREGIPFLTAFVVSAPTWYLWALVTPVILRLTQRFPVDRSPRTRSILAHVSTAILVSAGIGAVAAFIVVRADLPPAEGYTLREQVIFEFVFWLVFGLILYATTAATGFALDHYRKMRDRELHASRLEAQLVEARLNTLRTQLEPHFFFNALNTVSMLVRQGDGPGAVRVVARLSELLRHVLEESGDATVPLATEIDFVSRYLEIEQHRFRDRLRVEIEIDDDVADACLPGLLLQPLVENAVRHGIGARAAAGLISIRAFADGDRVIIRIGDDGPGFQGAAASANGSGIGLRNTRERLRYLYGSDASLHIGEREGGGAELVLSLPRSHRTANVR